MSQISQRQRLSRHVMGLAILLTLCSTGLYACNGCEEKKGPLERTGEKIDEGVHDTKRAIEDAAD